MMKTGAALSIILTLASASFAMAQEPIPLCDAITSALGSSGYAKSIKLNTDTFDCKTQSDGKHWSCAIGKVESCAPAQEQEVTGASTTTGDGAALKSDYQKLMDAVGKCLPDSKASPLKYEEWTSETEARMSEGKRYSSDGPKSGYVLLKGHFRLKQKEVCQSLLVDVQISTPDLMRPFL